MKINVFSFSLKVPSVFRTIWSFTVQKCVDFGGKFFVCEAYCKKRKTKQNKSHVKLPFGSIILLPFVLHLISEYGRIISATFASKPINVTEMDCHAPSADKPDEQLIREIICRDFQTELEKMLKEV